MKSNIVDLHNDAITELSPTRFRKYIKKAERAGVEIILISIWTTKMQSPISQIRAYKQVIDSIETNIKLLLHIEDVWFLNKQNIGDFLELKPFSIGLVWNERNPIAGGAYSEDGISELGKYIIKELCQAKVLIDLAHLNKQSFFEVVKILSAHHKSLLCTHTCFNEINFHLRNLDHDQIQEIINSNGLVGLTFVGNFLHQNKRVCFSNIYDHIVYFLQNFNENNLAIGTDFFGTKNLPIGLRKYKHFEHFKKFLLKKGLSDEIIKKIFHLNAKKFLTGNSEI